MVTRLYLSSSVAADVNPNFEAGWTQTAGADRRKCSVTKSNSALANAVMAGVNGTTLVRQYVSPPMNAQSIVAGTVKGTVRVLESAVNDNILQICFSIKVVNRAGDTYGGTDILGKGQYGPSNEWAAALTNRRVADGDATVAVTVNQGDRLVIHLGYYVSSGTTISGSMNFGDDQASDCADDETGTAAYNPFIELSQTIVWEPPIYYKSATVTEESALTTAKKQRRGIIVTETSQISLAKRIRLLASIVEAAVLTVALKRIYIKTANIVETSSITASLKKVFKRAANITVTSVLVVQKVQRRVSAIQESSIVQVLKRQQRQHTIITTGVIQSLKRQSRITAVQANSGILVVKRQRRSVAIISTALITTLLRIGGVLGEPLFGFLFIRSSPSAMRIHESHSRLDVKKGPSELFIKG